MNIKQYTQILTLSALTIGAAGPARAQNVIDWWQAENNFLDSVGASQGIAPNVNYVSGKSGQSFEFDNGAAILVTNRANLNPATITVQLWVKRAGSPGTYDYIMHKAKGPSNGNASYALYTSGTGNVQFFVTTGSGGNGLILSGSPASTVWDGNWHQVTGVFDGSQVLLYVDGALASSSTPLGTPASIDYTGASDLLLGAYLSAPNLNINGAAVDEIRIFDHALTAADVMDTYANASSPALTAGVISYWNADGNTHDSVGGNNGTVIWNTIANFGFGPGKNGQGFVANGGALAVQNSPAPSPTFSVQAWVQTCDVGQFNYIMSRYPGYSLYTAGRDSLARNYPGLSFFSDPSGTNATPSAPSGRIWDGAWHQVTGVFDGNSNLLYIDGVVFSHSAASYVTPGGGLAFADYTPAGGAYWRGLLDDIKIYDAGLSGAQVMQTYTNSLGGGLAGWWRAEGDALDALGVNNGTFSAATYGAGKFSGHSFITSNGVVVIPASTSLQPANITVSALVKSTPPGNNKYIVNKAFDGSGGSYAFQTGPNGGLVFSVNTTGGVLTSPALSPAQVWDNSFHGIAGSYDGQTVRLYLDGVEVGSGTPGAGQIQYNSSSLLFGDFTDTPSAANYIGCIDEVRIYSTARTAKDIKADIASGVAIVLQPQSQTATLGDTRTLSVNARGYLKPLSYQWQQNGTDIPNATNASLTLSNIQAFQAGTYNVKVKGGSGVGLVTDVSSKLAGQAFHLADYNIDVPNNGSLEVEAFTYLLWVRSSTSPGAYTFLLSKTKGFPGTGETWVSGDAMVAVALQTDANSGLQGVITVSQVDNIFGDTLSTNQYWTPMVAGVATNLWDGQWHQVGLAWDGTNLMTYLDGALSSSYDTTTNNAPGTVYYSDGSGYQNGDLVLGGLIVDDIKIRKYSGDMDEIKFFNRALTPAEINNNFMNPSVNPSGLVSWWSGDDGTAGDVLGANNGFALPEIGTVGRATSEPATLSVTVPARLVNASVSSGQFQATVSGPSGALYAVEKTASLVNPTWVPMTTNTVPFSFSESMGGGSSFYRAVAR